MRKGRSVRQRRPPRTYGIWLPADRPLTVGDITVSNLSDHHERLVPCEDLLVPHSFTATFDRPPLPRVTLEISLVDRRLRCVSVSLRAAADGKYVETRDLCQTPVVKLINEAATLVAYHVVRLDDEAEVAFVRERMIEYADLVSDPVRPDEIQVGDYFRFPVLAPLIEGEMMAYAKLAAETRARFDGQKRRGRRAGVPTDEDVAGVYRAAYAQRLPVTDAVATKFNWQRQTARNRIRRARKKGFLPETGSGRAQA
jgi:hypothetical protein